MPPHLVSKVEPTGKYKLKLSNTVLHISVNESRRLKTTLSIVMSWCPYASAVTHLTSLSWRSLRMVLFLLMWRRRSNTKTDRPAIRTAKSPPTTPAAIMERPALKDKWSLVFRCRQKTELLHKNNKQAEMTMDCQAQVKSLYTLLSINSATVTTHVLFWQPSRPGPVHL